MLLEECFVIKKKRYGHNEREQEKLEKIVKKRGYLIGNQYSNNRNVFLHIMGNLGVKSHDVVKLYINCERKNIALLTGAIFGEICGMVGDKLQMKCISEQYMEEDKQREEANPIKNYQRNDKIVIFSESEREAEMIAEKIRELRIKYPNLFSEKKAMPLLPKKYGFIGYGKETYNSYAKTPVGIASGRTYNDYMSNIMFDCVVAGFDENICGTSTGHSIGPEQRMSEYVKIYNEMLPEQRLEILNKCKTFFLQVCKENGVNTIYTPFVENELGGKCV